MRPLNRGQVLPWFLSIGCQFVWARLGGLQPSALDGLLASRPVAPAGKAVWPICRQITRTPWLARCVWPTRGLAVSTCHERRIASLLDWQPDVAGKPLGIFAGKPASPIACQRARVGWLQIARPLRTANRPAARVAGTVGLHFPTNQASVR